MKTLLIILLAGLFSSGLSAQTYKGKERAQTLEEKLNAEYCTGLFQSTEGIILDIASNPGAKTYLNILEWLEGRVAGLTITKNRSGILVPFIRGGVPGIYVDEIQVGASHLNAVSSNDIAMIKIIKTPFHGGANSAHGAIAIYTFRGEEDEDNK